MPRFSYLRNAIVVDDQDRDCLRSLVSMFEDRAKCASEYESEFVMAAEVTKLYQELLELLPQLTLQLPQMRRGRGRPVTVLKTPKKRAGRPVEYDRSVLAALERERVRITEEESARGNRISQRDAIAKAIKAINAKLGRSELATYRIKHLAGKFSVPLRRFRKRT